MPMPQGAVSSQHMFDCLITVAGGAATRDGSTGPCSYWHVPADNRQSATIRVQTLVIWVAASLSVSKYTG